MSDKKELRVMTEEEREALEVLRLAVLHSKNESLVGAARRLWNASKGSLFVATQEGELWRMESSGVESEIILKLQNAVFCNGGKPVRLFREVKTKIEISVEF